VTGCGGDKKEPAKGETGKVVLKVGATPVPHAELLNFVKPVLARTALTSR
jgi:D-methionine transport system substrate-binding protein